MQVDKATVRHIAKLARIRITDAEAEALEGELSAILDWVEQLDSVDTAGVEPSESVIDIPHRMREDVIDDGGRADDIVRNAPMTHEHFFVVPKVVE